MSTTSGIVACWPLSSPTVAGYIPTSACCPRAAGATRMISSESDPTMRRTGSLRLRGRGRRRVDGVRDREMRREIRERARGRQLFHLQRETVRPAALPHGERRAVQRQVGKPGGARAGEADLAALRAVRIGDAQPVVDEILGLVLERAGVEVQPAREAP